ncbi:MAG: 1-phosphofructokinase, partial [Deltaproteobacteria bacterium]|nr:1-phosphofructokinase [Deltaproteobacteria bacterium]
ILVSRGKLGLLFSGDGQIIKAVAPPVDVESAVGAGDSTVAGFILAHSRGMTLPECVRLACASGTATAQTPGTELCHKEDVEKILPQVDLSIL